MLDWLLVNPCRNWVIRLLAPGEADFLLSDLMTAPSQALQLPLRSARGRQLPAGCVVVLKGEELANTNAVVRGP